MCPVQVDLTQDACVCVDPICSSFSVVEVHKDVLPHTGDEAFMTNAVQVEPDNRVSEANEQIRLGICTFSYFS